MSLEAPSASLAGFSSSIAHSAPSPPAAPPPLPCDVRPVASLSCAELLVALQRIAAALFHHLPLAVAEVSGGEAHSRPPPPQAASDAETAERAALSQSVSSPLSSFLCSAPSPALFHRFGVFPSASSLAPRFHACLAALRELSAAHAARLRLASAPASLDRLSFFSSSLSSARLQHAALSASLQRCRRELRAEADRQLAASRGEAAFASVQAALAWLKSDLGLQTDEEAEAQERRLAGAEDGASAISGAVTVHVASGGSTSCFVLEVRLLRAAASQSDCVEAVHAEFLQGDAELRDVAVDAEVRALLRRGRFAALQRQLGHVLAMEALSDRFPQHALYARRAEVEQAMAELRKVRAAQPTHVSSALDGVRLSFHHIHQPAPAVRVDPLFLFNAPVEARMRFPDQPSLSFTHSLTWMGMAEAAPASTPSPSFMPVFFLSPPVLLPSSALQRLARMGASRHALAPSASHSRASAAPALSYHEAVVLGSGHQWRARARPSSTPASPPVRVRVFSAVHEYAVLNDVTSVDSACAVSYLALQSLAALPEAVHLLQQAIVFQQLYASLVHQHPHTAPSIGPPDTALLPVHRIDVTAFPPHSLSLRLRLPQPERVLAVDVRVASVAGVEPCSAVSEYGFDCHLVTASIERSFDSPAPCSDRYATDVLAMTLSIPLLVHALLHQAEALKAAA